MRPESKEATLAAAGEVLFLAIVVDTAAHAYYYPCIAAVMGMASVALPYLMRRSRIMAVPWPITAWVLAATFLHAFGIAAGLYDTIWWWDILTHVLATSLITVVGFIGLSLIEANLPSLHLPPRAMALVLISFIATIGMIWEALEFTFDGALGIGMQYSAEDTATDLTFDLLGGMLVAPLVPLYLSTRSVEETAKEVDAFGRLEGYARSWEQE